MIRLQEKSANLRIPYIFVRQHKRIHIKTQIAGGVAGLCQGNNPIVEERLINSRTCLDGRTPHDLSGRQMLHHHQILAVLNVFLPAVKGPVRGLKPGRQDRFVHGQASEAGAGQFGKPHQGLDIVEA